MQFSVSKIAAWSPTRQSEQDWRLWAMSDAAYDDAELLNYDVKKPKTALIPAMTRRRLTLWGAMATEVAAQCAEHLNEDMPTIFASRHGDTHRTFDLLQNVVDGEALSPTAFSLSVHNSSSGIFSIVQKLYANALALAAGKETLGHALLEAHNLFSQGHKKVLLTSSDIPLAPFYQPFADEVEQPHALAMVLEPPNDSGLPRLEVDFSFDQGELTSGSESTPALSLPLQFLKFWYSEAVHLRYAGRRQEWHFARLS